MSVERLETLLAQRTQGEWKAEPPLDFQQPFHWSVSGPESTDYDGYVDEADARLMALAPTLARLVIDMAAELRRIEWEGDTMYDVCPSCGGEPSNGHGDECQRAALLGRVDALNQHTNT